MKTKFLDKDGVKEGLLNRRTAIRKRCLDCSGWSPSEVATCPLDKCPLYKFRSGEGKQDPDARSKAIRAYCLWCCCGDSSEVRLCTAKTCALYMYRRG